MSRAARVFMAAFGHAPKTSDGDRLVILARSGLSRGKMAAAAVHAALLHLGVHPGTAVIVLGASGAKIEEECDTVVRDAGATEVEPGTVTAGVRR